jgi:hypothetical protein
VNEQSAKLTRWLLAGNGALKNVAKLLTDSFGPAAAVAAVAATVDAVDIVAYPVDPSVSPTGPYWTETPNGWVHPLHSKLLPLSTSAEHYVLAGVTSRNELLLVNLAAVGYLGVEGGDPIPMMRSWLIQVLSKTPTAAVTVTDPALAIPGAPRLTLVDRVEETPPDTSILLTTQHTSGPDGLAPIVVSSQAAAAANVVLCDGAVASIYLGNRYWPIWRRMELHEPQWTSIKATLVPQHVSLAGTTASARAAASAPAPQASASSAAIESEGSPPQLSTELSEATTAPPPTMATTDTPQPAAGSAPDDLTPVGPPAIAPLAEPATPQPIPQPLEQRPVLRTDVPAPPLNSLDGDPATNGQVPLTLPGPPGQKPTRRGLYALGEVFVLGADTSGDPVQHTAITRTGARKPVKALMALATSNGMSTNEWEDKILKVTSQNRRQLRTSIRKMMGGDDPIRTDERGLLVVDEFCDWKEFNRLVGHEPDNATTENLTAAVELIRGAPFEDIPDDDYDWRSVRLLKDDLITRCSNAALELAHRQHSAGATDAAYRTARLGIRVYPQREDLWVVAASTVSDSDRAGLIYDLKQAIPLPTTPQLRQLISTSRAH